MNRARQVVAEEYANLGKELYCSLVADLDAGRVDAATTRFRALGEACFRCIYTAKFATDECVKRGKVRGEYGGVSKLWLKELEAKGFPHVEKLAMKFDKMWGTFSRAGHADISEIKRLRRHTVRSFSKFYGRDLSRLEEEAEFLVGLSQVAAQGCL